MRRGGHREPFARGCRFATKSPAGFERNRPPKTPKYAAHIKKGVASSWACGNERQGARIVDRGRSGRSGLAPVPLGGNLLMQKDDEAGAWPNLRVIIIEDEALVV